MTTDDATNSTEPDAGRRSSAAPAKAAHDDHK